MKNLKRYRIISRIILILFLGINPPLFSESPALELSKTVDPIWLILCAALVFFYAGRFFNVGNRSFQIEKHDQRRSEKSYGLYRRNNRVLLRGFCFDVRIFIRRLDRHKSFLFERFKNR